MNSKIRQLAITAFLALLLYLVGLSPALVEKLYVYGSYPITSAIQRFLSSFFPFSLGDFLYIILVGYALYSVINGVKKLSKTKKYFGGSSNKPLLIQPINFLLILYVTFKLLWGLNYVRLPIAEQLGISNEKYTTAQLVALGDYMTDRINKIQAERNPDTLIQHIYSITELETKAAASYKQLAAKNSFFKYNNPSLKPVLNSWLVTKIGLEGYYNPLSGEANANMMLNAANLPFVACHEISHQLGIAREDEANLIGYLVATASSDLDFKYSGNYCVLKNVLFEIGVKSPADYVRLRKKINAATLKDFKADKEFWRKYNSNMFGYMETTLDQFLKLNNQQKGVESYQDIVLWLYNIHKKALKLPSR
ncbi:DUF3810 domain-containing protein [Pedobacter sp. MC2016-14]|uniref:DUF3810 domain-containing protein n=1 Tax=Pedobacter sp. MC2016-14 TaxID=2897327 RepID=UPI001E4D63AB|nr:DUF3810 domain-containing protein [Pedobacter sp. MC2016-14]MCD0488490.1 DUF3810 domain-containing protein [Pedobacter sp. MC2016-14]